MNEPELRFKADDGSEFPEWKGYKLGDLAEIRSAARVHRDEWQTSGVPFYRSSDVMAFLNGKDNEKAFISKEFYEKLCQTSGKLQKGDILITGGGSIGTPYIVPNDDPLYTKDADLLWIKRNENLDPEFLYTYFFTPNYRKYLMAVSHIGTIAHYTIEQIKATPVIIPSIPEQQKIADLFSTIDNVINSVQKEVDSWEQMKRGVMQKLFSQEVRFKADDGSEFPDWENTTLGEKTIIMRGGSPRPIERYITNDDTGLNWIKIGDVSPDDNIILSTKEKIKPEGLSKTRQVYKGDLILSNSMSYGRPYIVGIDGCIHDGWLLIRDNNKNFNLKYLCYVLSEESVKRQYDSLCAGSTVKNLNADIVRAVKIDVPCIEEQQKIADCLSEFDLVIEKTKQKLEAYKQLKKGLMQRMFV